MNSQRDPEASKRLRATDQWFPAALRGTARLAGRYSVIGLLVLVAVGIAATVPAPALGGDIGISIRIGPPPLPVYEQPLCPGAGYIWTPGYWAYDPVDGYYWVPGTWVEPPEPGLLWTPGYWGWEGGLFRWHAGYWGPQVGFYGGVDYGFGYTGSGYEGGYWRGHDFYYNRAVNNVTNVTNVYSRTVVKNVNVRRVSYNGGPGGLNVRPTHAQMQAEHDRHIAATPVQQQHQSSARQDRSQFASVNHGKPAVMASARPSEFHGNGAARPEGRQGKAPHGAVRTPANNPRMEHSNSGGGAAHPARAATPPANRNAEKPQARTPNLKPRQAQHQPSHATPSRTPETAPRPQAHQAGRANPPAQERPQVRESEPRPNQEQPSHAAPSRKPESAPRPQARPNREQPPHAAPARTPERAPRPQAHEERKANPLAAERKPQGHEPEKHH